MLHVLEVRNRKKKKKPWPRHSLAWCRGRWFRALFREELRSGGQTWSSNHSPVISPQETSCYYYKDEVLLFFFFFWKNFLKVFLPILIQFKSMRQEGLRAAMPATLANQTPKKHSIPLRRALENGLLMVAFKINWGLPGWMDSLQGWWPGSRLVPSRLASCWGGGPLIKRGCLACSPHSWGMK